MSEAHQREAALFDAALELPPDQRSAYLDRTCSGDPALRRRIESLLKASDSQCAFLDSPSSAELRRTLQTTVPLSEKPGDRIGPFKLLEQIGEGGCGVVYVAEQTEPMRRRVALKIVKLGMDTKSVIARFEAERQALALMEHPNIAKALDAGATKNGRPYFVMELVRGVRITDYCDEKRLSTRARLNLFIKVCQAIQHAHQKGIIHRDIKPSNILVTINDGVAVPKVIDFGVAKAIGGQSLTDKTVYTAFEQFIGTPAYVSPEQTVMTSLDVDTRSDIYALGVLLYELLTGKTPFDSKELLSVSLEAMQRTICESEPPRPSTCLGALTREQLSTTAQRRSLDAPKLFSELRGDLDWIVMRALEKDRERRYETAIGLAMDVERHLSNEPVVARPPSGLYRLGKLIRRNKLAFAAGFGITASLVVGLSLSTILFFRERTARERADEQTAIAQAVNAFLQQDLIGQSSSYNQADAGFTPNPDLTVREALERAAERVDRFKDHPLQEAAVRRAIGRAYQDLGHEERAIPHLERALELDRAELPPNHLDTLRAMRDLGNAYNRVKERDKAIPLYEETLQRMKIALGPDHLETLELMRNLGQVYSRVGKHDLAFPFVEEALERARAKLGPDHLETVSAINALSNVYYNGGDFDKAVPLKVEIVKLYTARVGRDHLDTLRLMRGLAIAYRDAGDFDNALPLFEEVLEGHKSLLGSDHHDTLLATEHVVTNYLKVGQVEKALTLFRQLVDLRISGQGYGIGYPYRTNRALGYLSKTRKELAFLLRAVGKRDEAWDLNSKFTRTDTTPENPAELNSAAWRLATAFYPEWRDGSTAVAYAEKAVSATGRTNAPYLDSLAAAYAECGDFEKAAAVQQEAISCLSAEMGKNWHVGFARRILLYQSSIPWRENYGLAGQKLAEFVRGLITAGRFAEAEPLARECLTLREKLIPDDWKTFHSKSLLGGSLLGQKKYAEAEPLLLAGYEGLREREDQFPYVGRLRLEEALRRVAQLYEAMGPADRASQWRQTLAQFEDASAVDRLESESKER